MSEVADLADALRPLIRDEIAFVGREVDRILAKATKPKWSDQPQHKFHDAIVEALAPKLAAALKPSRAQIDAAIAAAKKKLPAKKATGGADPTPIQAAAAEAINANVKMSPDEAQNILRMIYGNAYVTGQHAAIAQMGGGANVTADLASADAAIDWDSWEPGEIKAADIVSSGAWQDLLDQADITIQSVQDNAMDRLANTLADGLSQGLSNESIAADMSDSVDTNALLIANTETARAQSAATQETYSDSGVSQFNWLAEDDACPECLDNAANGPYDVGDDPTIPQHPRCRCAYVPVILDANGNDLAAPDDGGDE